jgi:hypothetical protein
MANDFREVSTNRRLQIVRVARLAIPSEVEAVGAHVTSPCIREKKDFYAVPYDGGGRLIAGTNLPVFGDVVGPITELWTPGAGDRHGRCRSRCFNRPARAAGG